MFQTCILRNVSLVLAFYASVFNSYGPSRTCDVYFAASSWKLLPLYGTLAHLKLLVTLQGRGFFASQKREECSEELMNDIGDCLCEWLMAANHEQKRSGKWTAFRSPKGQAIGLWRSHPLKMMGVIGHPSLKESTIYWYLLWDHSSFNQKWPESLTWCLHWAHCLINESCINEFVLLAFFSVRTNSCHWTHLILLKCCKWCEQIISDMYTYLMIQSNDIYLTHSGMRDVGDDLLPGARSVTTHGISCSPGAMPQGWHWSRPGPTDRSQLNGLLRFAANCHGYTDI